MNMAHRAFDSDDDIREWMQDLAAIPTGGGPLPDARQIWWKAELLKRWESQRQVVAPIDRAEPVQVFVGLVGAAALVVSLWRYAPASNSVLFATIVSLMLLVTLGVWTFRDRTS